VIVRFSDFKSNEYKDLLGGDIFEPNEENPMLGFRGCSRYYSDSFKEAFKMECNAIKRVREDMGLTNTIVMLPFCRTVQECQKTLATMKEFGLERGVKGLQVYLMCEIPSNVILADEFCTYVDGFSIGSNDLTQLCLGLDRDAGTLTHIGNETNPAVKKMIQMAIESCKRNGVKVGICGQGPSDIPEFAQFLMDLEIDSISLIPDSIKDFLLNNRYDE
jgi:pyruvate,water dikinase